MSGSTSRRTTGDRRLLAGRLLIVTASLVVTGFCIWMIVYYADANRSGGEGGPVNTNLTALLIVSALGVAISSVPLAAWHDPERLRRRALMSGIGLIPLGLIALTGPGLGFLAAGLLLLLAAGIVPAAIGMG